MSYLIRGSAFVVAIAFYLRPVLGHCKIVNVAANLDQPGPRSHGFVVDLHGKHPWHVGQPGDAGADAVFYSPRVEYVANPKFPCGQLAILPHGVDIPAALSQAEAQGVATTASDGSFEALIFQVNRDGAGSCTCEYDPTATANSWNRCQTLINPPGIQGMWQSDRTNHTAKFQIPSSTVCKGGSFKDKCLIRIRCGYKLRFGGCFALKTPASPKPLQLKVVGGQSALSSTGGQSDIDSIAAKIFAALQAKGAIVPRSNSKKSSSKRGSNNGRALQTSDSLSSASVDRVAAKVIQMIKNANLQVKADKASMVAKSYLSNS